MTKRALHKAIIDAEDMSGRWPRNAGELTPPMDPAEAWKRFRKRFPSKKKKPLDLQRSVPALAVAVANLPKEPDVLAVETAAAIVHMDWHSFINADPAVEYLCSRMSPAEVLQALLLAASYHHGGYDTHFIEINADSHPLVTQTFPYWKAFLRASEEESAEARALADKRWEDASMQQRGTLLSCFPDRADWALEFSKTTKDQCQSVLLATLQDADALSALVWFGPQQVNVVENLPLDQAIAYLDECFDQATDEAGMKPTCNALARICTPEAAAVFVKHMRKKVVRARALTYFTSHPELALGALSELAKKKTKLAATAREIIERAERSDAAAKSGGETSVAADKAGTPESAAPESAAPESAAPEANLSEVPAVLRDPPWPKKRKASETKPLEGLTIPTEPCRMHWPLLSRQRHIVQRLSWVQSVSGMACKPLSEIREAAEAEELAGNWDAQHILAVHGQDAAAAVSNVIVRGKGYSAPAFRGETLKHWGILESPAFATCLEIDTPDVWAWLRRYPESAVAGLVPATLMAKRKPRALGEARLRWMQQLGHDDAIRRVADGHGEEARGIIDAILEGDPHDEVPAKPPKMGKSYRPAELRAPILKSGQRLPLAAVERLCEMLAFSPVTPAYVGIDDVREACTSESLSDFAWDLAKGWSLGGHRANELWMLHAVAHYGDDEAVRRLTPELNGAGISDMLGDIGTDAALMELGNIKMHCASMSRPPKYSEGHEEAIRSIAQERGVSIDELEEQYVPHVGGLDDSGALTLDLGPAKVRVTFDTQLLPLLHDEQGERLKALPRGKKYDATLLKTAKSALKQLEQDATAIGLQRLQSLRRALVQQREWSKKRFEQIFVRHPLMRNMTRALIWQSVDGSAFRVTEDGSFANVEESELKLPDDAQVRLCHPLSLSAEERAAWAEILADYDQVQPIEQLVMDTSFPEDALDAVELVQEVSGTFEEMPREGDVTPRLGWIKTSQHSGFPVGDSIVILYVRHPKLIGRVLGKELKQIAFKDADPRARVVLARAMDAMMTPL